MENKGLNRVSYNGQDYKSTTYQQGTNINEEWYDLSNATQNETRMSDAKDDLRRRLEVIKNCKTMQNNLAETLASFDARKWTNSYYETENPESRLNYYDEDLHDVSKALTWMFADTAKFNVQIEYDTTTSNGIDELQYSIPNVDFGLEKRPETKLELTKEIVGIKLQVIETGEILIDTSNGIDKNVNAILNKRDYVNGYAYKRFSRYYSYTQGPIHIYVEDEVMNTRLIVDYKITITNKGEIDYTSADMDVDSKVDYTSLFIDTKSGADYIRLFMDANNKADYISIYMDDDGKVYYLDQDIDYTKMKEYKIPTTLGVAYYEGRADRQKDRIVTAKIDKIIDYVDNNFTFREEENPQWSLVQNIVFPDTNIAVKYNEEEYGTSTATITTTAYNREFNLPTIIDMMQKGYLNPDLVIKQTNDATDYELPVEQVVVTNYLAGLEIQPEEGDSKYDDYPSSRLVYLRLSKALQAGEDTDTLTFSNIAEILQYTNTVGRRDMDAIPGNQDPDVTEDGSMEYDADISEKIIITPPTGENKSIIYFVIIPLSILIITAGIIIIIKMRK